MLRLLLALALACGVGAVPLAAQPDASGAEKAAEASPESADALTPRNAIEAQAKFAHRLLMALGKDAKPGDNIVVSPASLAAVFAVLDVGADETLRSAIHQMLGFDQRGDAAKDLQKLRATVKALSTEKGGPLALANAIVFDPAAKPHAEAVETLKGFNVDVRVEDLSKPETIERINKWVLEQTQELIPSILSQPLQNAGLVALNALHFKDRWAVPFDPKLTKPGTFRVRGGEGVAVPLMHMEKLTGKLHADGDFVGVDLGYASDRFSLAVVTTAEKPGAPADFDKAAEWFPGGFGGNDGSLALPRFSLETTSDLLSALDALGLAKGRESPHALAKLSPVAQTISRVVQRTNLRIDEAGTEAAAATAVITGRSLGPRQFINMIVDRPFIFVLRDRQSGLILLAGYVARPQ